MDKKITKTRKLVLTAMLFAVAMVLSIIESSLPPIIVTVPGIKLGLSNIAVMYTLFFVNKKQAFMLAILKAMFVFMIRGGIAAFLSLSGGIASLLIMLLVIMFFKDKVSYLVISIFGAIFHNIGQLLAISLIFTSVYTLFYLPVLLISGVIAGIITATLLKFIFPALKKLGLK